jgi:hypothetical protein
VISKISSLCFGPLFAFLQERKTDLRHVVLPVKLDIQKFQYGDIQINVIVIGWCVVSKLVYCRWFISVVY